MLPRRELKISTIVFPVSPETEPFIPRHKAISRLAFSLFPEGARGVGYFTVLMIDLICIIFIYSRMPVGGKEVESHD